MSCVDLAITEEEKNDGDTSMREIQCQQMMEKRGFPAGNVVLRELL